MAQAAKSSSVHSYVVRAMMAIRSPGISPSPINPLASASTSSANAFAVTSNQSPSGPFRLSTTWAGASLALSNGMSASEPCVIGATSGGTDASRTTPSSRLRSGSTRAGAGVEDFLADMGRLLFVMPGGPPARPHGCYGADLPGVQWEWVHQHTHYDVRECRERTVFTSDDATLHTHSQAPGASRPLSDF